MNNTCTIGETMTRSEIARHHGVCVDCMRRPRLFDISKCDYCYDRAAKYRAANRDQISRSGKKYYLKRKEMKL